MHAWRTGISYYWFDRLAPMMFHSGGNVYKMHTRLDNREIEKGNGYTEPRENRN